MVLIGLVSQFLFTVILLFINLRWKLSMPESEKFELDKNYRGLGP
jgi:hypothetical protein